MAQDATAPKTIPKTKRKYSLIRYLANPEGACSIQMFDLT